MVSDKYGEDTGDDEGDGGEYGPLRDPPDSADCMPTCTPVREGGADSDQHSGDSGERE